MRALAFIRAMKWKGLIITAIVTAILGLVLTLYSCRHEKAEKELIKTEQAGAKAPPASDRKSKADKAVCTATSCEVQ